MNTPKKKKCPFWHRFYKERHETVFQSKTLQIVNVHCGKCNRALEVYTHFGPFEVQLP